MKKVELDRLKAELQGNANYIGLGFEFAKNMIIDQVLEEKRNQMQNQYDFSRFKDVIVNSVLQQELQRNPLEEEVKEDPSIKPDKDVKEGTSK